MKLNERESDLFQALIGTSKSAASLFPVLGQAIAGYDSYKRSIFERNLEKALKHLHEKVEDIQAFFEDDWYKSEEGKLFGNKVLDAALDAQLEDKQELFINTLINGPRCQSSNQLEKLKFVDILRHMSRASLMVLADIHNLLVQQVRRENQQNDELEAFPLISVQNLTNELSDKYHPYLINSAIKEMEGQGLFSNFGSWKKDGSGKYRSAGGFESDICYTEFAAKFVEFIMINGKFRGHNTEYQQ